MKTHTNHSKLKTHTPRPLFNCSFFRHCTQTTLSPTTPNPHPLHLSTPPPPPLPPTSSPPPPPTPPPPPPPPPFPRKPRPTESSSSSSYSFSTSQSFTQWKFPLHHHDQTAPPEADSSLPLVPLHVLFHAAQVQFSTGSDTERLYALQMLARSLVPNPPADPVCPSKLMREIVLNLRNSVGSKPATKILLALCLAEGNRLVAVEAGAVGTVLEVAMELESVAAERALAVLELTCTVAAGAEELRGHALAVPVMVTMMGKMAGRGREYAISALGVIYGGCGMEGEGMEKVQHAPPEEVARAVELALQGDSTARGRRKGAQLLKTLKEYGRQDFSQEEN